MLRGGNKRNRPQSYFFLDGKREASSPRGGGDAKPIKKRRMESSPGSHIGKSRVVPMNALKIRSIDTSFSPDTTDKCCPLPDADNNLIRNHDYLVDSVTLENGNLDVKKTGLNVKKTVFLKYGTMYFAVDLADDQITKDYVKSIFSKVFQPTCPDPLFQCSWCKTKFCNLLQFDNHIAVAAYNLGCNNVQPGIISETGPSYHYVPDFVFSFLDRISKSGMPSQLFLLDPHRRPGRLPLVKREDCHSLPRAKHERQLYQTEDNTYFDLLAGATMHIQDDMRKIDGCYLACFLYLPLLSYMPYVRPFWEWASHDGLSLHLFSLLGRLKAPIGQNMHFTARFECAEKNAKQSNPNTKMSGSNDTDAGFPGAKEEAAASRVSR